MRWDRRAATSAALAVGLAAGAFGTAAPALAADEECSLIAPRFSPQAPPALAQLGISDAWTVTRGAGVTVAVVDTGVDAANPYLAEAVRPGVDLVEPGGDGRRDASGRGTDIAGQIAARTLPDSGVSGVAPAAVILPVRVAVHEQAQNPNDPLGPNPDVTAQGITWAADQQVEIIVVPQDFESTTPALSAAVDHATAAGALVVASAGDANAASGQDANTVRYPAGLPPALSVTALDSAGNPAGSAGVHVDLAAPGQDVLTTFRGLGDCTRAVDAASSAYATGYAGGVAALVAAAYPREFPVDWEYRLLATALRPSQAERTPSTGWGVIAPLAALDLVDDGGRAGPENPRYAAPATAVPPVMQRPEPSPDHTGPRRSAVGWLVGGAAAGSLALALLIALLRRPNG